MQRLMLSDIIDGAQQAALAKWQSAGH